MSDKVSITRSKLEELVRDSLRLEALYQAGVDNWQGYGDAYKNAEKRMEAFDK